MENILPKLTKKQQDFVIHYAINGVATQAYRMAYDCTNMSDDTIKNEASRLLKNKKIAQWIDELNKNKADVVKKEFEYTVQDAFTELNDLQNRCSKSQKTYNVEKSCIDSKCKLAGLFNEENKYENNVVVTMGDVIIDDVALDFDVGSND